jgi:hypothetical protein
LIRRAEAADQRAIGSGRFIDTASLLKCTGLIEDSHGRPLDQPRLGCGAKARGNVLTYRNGLLPLATPAESDRLVNQGSRE